MLAERSFPCSASELFSPSHTRVSREMVFSCNQIYRRVGNLNCWRRSAPAWKTTKHTTSLGPFDDDFHAKVILSEYIPSDIGQCKMREELVGATILLPSGLCRDYRNSMLFPYHQVQCRSHPRETVCKRYRDLQCIPGVIETSRSTLKTPSSR